MLTKNRGAISNPTGRFEKAKKEAFDDGWEKDPENESITPLETVLLRDNAQSIISRNDSPDLGFEQTINPYKGCEHGCIYCYARPSHAYMNLSAGLDFETKIFYKPDAAQLLEKELSKPKYECKVIVLGANTDPYQPVESKLKTTRSLLEVLNRYHHPVTIISKGSLMERDLDILEDMAKRQLVKVAVTLTTLSISLKQILEPRAATPKARLNLIHKLTAIGVPVRVMAAPMIPTINDMELEKILEAAREAGAVNAGYTLIRLPHEVKDLFKEWLAKHFPDRAQHVMSIIKQMHNGKEYDSSFGQRMRGQGKFADLLEMRFKIACSRFQLNQTSYSLNTKNFQRPKPYSPQLDLFDE